MTSALWRHTPGHPEYGRKRTPDERRRDRAAGVDRYGKPLPRTLGTNPRALAQQRRDLEELPPAA